ncbi:hypothetical protein J132_07726, partial [Termitomyces sp. J132]
RGAIKFASLNIKGGGSTLTRTKWNELCQIIREEKIDVLAIQETQLDSVKTAELNSLFERQVLFISSLDPDTPNAKGVAFIINKRSVK